MVFFRFLRVNELSKKNSPFYLTFFQSNFEFLLVTERKHAGVQTVLLQHARSRGGEISVISQVFNR